MARKGLNMVTVSQYAAIQREQGNPVSVQRIRKLLQQNRFPGALKLGPRVWLLPSDAPWPAEKHRGQGPGGKPDEHTRTGHQDS